MNCFQRLYNYLYKRKDMPIVKINSVTNDGSLNNSIISTDMLLPTYNSAISKTSSTC